MLNKLRREMEGGEEEECEREAEGSREEKVLQLEEQRKPYALRTKLMIYEII